MSGLELESNIWSQMQLVGIYISIQKYTHTHTKKILWYPIDAGDSLTKQGKIVKMYRNLINFSESSSKVKLDNMYFLFPASE